MCGKAASGGCTFDYAADKPESTGQQAPPNRFGWASKRRHAGGHPKMRVLGLVVAGMLALTAPIPGRATQPKSNTGQLIPVPSAVKVWGGSGWDGPVPCHWSRWRGGWVPPHRAPSHYYGWWGPFGSSDNAYGWGGRYGPYDDWGTLWYPCRGWRGASRGWGNP